jgi:hypothetical protein
MELDILVHQKALELHKKYLEIWDEPMDGDIIEGVVLMFKDTLEELNGDKK